MCGIGGILRLYPPGVTPPPPEASIPEAWLDALDAGIKHRGPDGQGRFRDRAARVDGSIVDVAFVHRRLSIIDHAGGHQPMVSEQGRPHKGEGRVAVVFNGCIYNHRELRKELTAAGHRFTTDHSDTEVLIHAWREWGEEMTPRLEGMFAFALWDASHGALMLARDFHGEKPLYGFRIDFNGLLFASSPLALRSFDQGPVKPAHLSGWLSLGYDPERTPTGLHTLKPGQTLFHPRAPSGAVSPTFVLVPRPVGSPHAIDAVNLALEEAVHSRLEADVPVACLLSGGVDSSLIAFAAAYAGPLTTICVRMPDARYDESAYAAETAQVVGSRHITVEASPSPAADLVSLIETLDLPFGDSSLLPTYWAAKAARQHAKVLLGGDGGDEYFYGYERYLAARWLRWCRLAPSVAAKYLARGAHPKSRRSKFARLAAAAHGAGYADLLAIFPTNLLRRLSPDFTPPEDPRAYSADEAAAWDLSTHLPGDLLRKVDHATMLAGVEMRSPFLARQVIDAATHYPARVHLKHGRKGLLRQLARRYFPAPLVDRPKMGFAIPLGEWFRTDYGGMKTLLLDTLHSADPFPADLLHLEINKSFVHQMLREHLEEKRDHAQRLYMLLVLSIWLRHFRR